MENRQPINHANENNFGSEGKDNKVSYAQIEAIIAQLEGVPSALKLLDTLGDTDPADQQTLQKLHARALEIQRKRQEIKEKKFSLREAQDSKENKFTQLEKASLERLKEIIENVKKEGKFLGQGATGIVYVDTKEPNRCYKIIKENDQYAQVNSVGRETEFLSALADLEVDGVRTPKPHYWAMHEQYHVLVMERFPGISLDKIVYGSEKFPPNFDIDTYFKKLDAYIDAMHARGIHHRDLNLQNIMVDLQTGDPGVIDFGKSCFALTSDDPYLTLDQEKKISYKYPDDKEKVVENRKKVKEYLDLKP
jgi:serine/threonine protein kinase